MRTIITIMVSLYLVSTLTGCDKLRTMINKQLYKKNYEALAVAEQLKKAEPTKIVENPDLAKVLLKPTRHPISVTRDPFKPLIEPKKKDAPQIVGGVLVEPKLTEEEALKDMKFLGLIKIAGTFSALIKHADKKGVFQLNDVVNKLTITDIREEYVALTIDDQTFKLKRGEK